MFKKLFACLGMLCIAMAVAPVAAFGQAYPTKTIRLILPFGAGTGSDVTTRIILAHIEQKTGASFVVENRVGAFGIVGTQAGVRLPADGYNVLMTSSSSHSIAGMLQKNLPYDPVKDFAHIGVLTLMPSAIMVTAESKYKTIGELMKDMQASPGRLQYGYASGTTWIAGAKFQHMVNLSSQAISYKSSQEALTDLIGNRLDFVVTDGITASITGKGGRGRTLLVLGDDKYNGLPSVPAMKEAGFPPIRLIGWTGIATQANAPAEARAWLKKTFTEVLKDPVLRDKLLNVSAQPASGIDDPDKFVADQLRAWTEAARDGGVKFE